mmetsp:Transcript_11316/g.23145  ORF Transcript_11316/g.23145 Transcript_11316/m.23145 type:complete len:92 (-) Transcript_11316:182-457(-)
MTREDREILVRKGGTTDEEAAGSMLYRSRWRSVIFYLLWRTPRLDSTPTSTRIEIEKRMSTCSCLLVASRPQLVLPISAVTHSLCGIGSQY